jgi:hypothetical protein
MNIDHSLNNINKLIFGMETCCVFYKVEAKLLNILYTNLGFGS